MKQKGVLMWTLAAASPFLILSTQAFSPTFLLRPRSFVRPSESPTGLWSSPNNNLENDKLCSSDNITCNELDERISCNRRQLLSFSSAYALATATAASLPQSAYSEAIPSTETKTLNLDCLLDLPPLQEDYCRIFLCRHGQTENNRLRLVQGSRLNPPINDIGTLQAARMGLALARANPSPSVLFHSPLKRALQTAQEANRQGNLLEPSQSLQTLNALMEVDFGPVAEGQPVKEAKPGMMATYARWAFGDIDYRPEGGGDSGRDIIVRATEAVQVLTQAAASGQCPNRCVAAVTHSTYLRMLLAVFADKSFVEASNLKTVNGCINVLDVNIKGETRTIGPKSKLVGGLFSRAPKDFRLEIPVAKVVRINEMRHLEGIQ